MGGVWTRLKLALAAFFTILFNGQLPAALRDGRPPEPAAATAPPVSDHSAIRDNAPCHSALISTGLPERGVNLVSIHVSCGPTFSR